jgi:hypothetical protein
MFKHLIIENKIEVIRSTFDTDISKYKRIEFVQNIPKVKVSKSKNNVLTKKKRKAFSIPV